MEHMTLEEINMAKCIDAQERDEMLRELRKLLRHCEGFLRELVESTVNKLEQMSEEDFKALMEYPAEIYDEEEQVNGR
jgi:hypothetical protein